MELSLSDLTVSQLYQIATQHEMPGRSKDRTKEGLRTLISEYFEDDAQLISRAIRSVVRPKKKKPSPLPRKPVSEEKIPSERLLEDSEGPEETQRAALFVLKVPELKERAKAAGVPRYYRLRKDELIDALLEKPEFEEVEEVEEVEEEIKVEEEEVEKDCITRSKVLLKKHQVRVAEYMKTHRGLIVVHDVGSGKTLAAIAASQCVLDEAEAQGRKIRVLVITPKSLRENFKKEMRKYGLRSNDPRYEFYTIVGFHNAWNRGKVSCANTFLIIDEAHNLRTAIPAKKRTKLSQNRAHAAILCARRAWKVMLLTATAIYNKIRDVVNLVALVHGTLPLTEAQFERLVYDADEEEFRSYFECIWSFHEVQKGKNYPQVNVELLRIEMTPGYLASYEEVEFATVEKKPAWVKIPEITEEGALIYEKRKIWHFYVLLREAANEIEPGTCLKCPYAMDIILRNQKTLIYSNFLSRGLDLLKTLLVEREIPYVEIRGETKEKERKRAVQKFNQDDGPNVFFISKAGGEGIDLRGVRNVIIFEPAWNRSTENQAIGRAVRYRSHVHLPLEEQLVSVYYTLLVKPENVPLILPHMLSVDDFMYQLAERKEEAKEALLQRLIPLSIENTLC